MAISSSLFILLSPAVLCLLIVADIGIFATDQFDYFVFAQQWPQTNCLDARASHEHKCEIADNVTEWTVHGMWPTKAGSLGPNFCNKSRPFNPEAIQNITDQLLKYWPNLFVDTNVTSFWKHEWEKHGTCASSLPAVDNENKYFSTGLSLNKKFDIFSALGKANIVPRDNYTYEYTDFISRLTKGIGGNPTIQCSYDKKTKTQYIGQVEICVGKKFEVVDCKRDYNRGLKRLAESTKLFTAAGKPGTVTLGQMSPCFDTENIAYPTVKHGSNALK